MRSLLAMLMAMGMMMEVASQRALEPRVLEGHVLEGHVLEGHVLEGHVLEDELTRLEEGRRPPAVDQVLQKLAFGFRKRKEGGREEAPENRIAFLKALSPSAEDLRRRQQETAAEAAATTTTTEGGRPEEFIPVGEAEENPRLDERAESPPPPKRLGSGGRATSPGESRRRTGGEDGGGDGPLVLPVTEGEKSSSSSSSQGLPKELMPIHPGGGSRFEDLERERLERAKMAQTKGGDDDDDEGEGGGTGGGTSHDAESLYSSSTSLCLSSLIVSFSSLRILV